MIDSAVIDSYDSEELQATLKQCFATLHAFGVFEKQLTLEKERLLSGNSEESEVDLAKSILAYRSKTQQLQLLDDLGRTYAREMQDDS